MGMKGKPKGIRFTQSERDRLTRLAKETTGGNQSEVVRALVAWATPERVKRALSETGRLEATG